MAETLQSISLLHHNTICSRLFHTNSRLSVSSNMILLSVLLKNLIVLNVILKNATITLFKMQTYQYRANVFSHVSCVSQPQNIIFVFAMLLILYGVALLFLHTHNQRLPKISRNAHELVQNTFRSDSFCQHSCMKLHC